MVMLSDATSELSDKEYVPSSSIPCVAFVCTQMTNEVLEISGTLRLQFSLELYALVGLPINVVSLAHEDTA